MAVIRISGQRLDMGDELAAADALEWGSGRDLDAEFIGLMGLAHADALDLRSMQGIDLPAPLALALVPDSRASDSGRPKCTISAARPASCG